MYKILVTTVVKVNTYGHPASVAVDTRVIEFDIKLDAVEAARKLNGSGNPDITRTATCLFPQL